MLKPILFATFVCSLLISCSNTEKHRFPSVPEKKENSPYKHTQIVSKQIQDDINTPRQMSSLPKPKPVAYGNKISEQDLLEIKVFKVPELSKVTRVDDSGRISMPLIDTVHAKGLTVAQLEKKLAALLQKNYIQNPQVSVFVKESTLRRITVDGSVNTPGVFPMKGQTTFLQAIAQSGGLGQFADIDNIILFRKDPVGKVLPYHVDLKQIREGTKPDITLQADDRIVVNEAYNKKRTKEIADTVRGFVAPFSLFGP